MTASLVTITMVIASNYLTVVGVKPMAAVMGRDRWVTSAAYSSTMLGFSFGGIPVGVYADKRGICLCRWWGLRST